MEVPLVSDGKSLLKASGRQAHAGQSLRVGWGLGVVPLSTGQNKLLPSE